MKLLPHLWNRIAYIWLILYLVAAAIMCWHFPQGVRPWLGIVNMLMILLACFSAEKVEDEGIRALRLSTIAWVTVAALLLHILSYLLAIAGANKDSLFVQTLDASLGDFPLWVLLFLLIFKARVLFGQWRACHEE